MQPRANRSELLDLSIKRSALWPNFRVFQLKRNQRVDPEEVEFADYLLKLGNGELPMNVLEEIELQQEIVSSGDLIEEVFGTCLAAENYEEMKHRAILTPTNKEAAQFNEKIIYKLPGELKSYHSFDTARDQLQDGAHYPQEYLNSMSPPDLPHTNSSSRRTLSLC